MGKQAHTPRDAQDRIVFLAETPLINPDSIAKTLVLEGRLPFQASYFLEWSARSWAVYSANETVIRARYEARAINKLGIEERLLGDGAVISFVGLATGEGFGEMEILKRLLRRDDQVVEGATLPTRPKVHYLGMDSSPQLLRNHIGRLQEMFATELANGDLLCAGVVADVFTGLAAAVNAARSKFVAREWPLSGSEFLPVVSPMLVTYLGNCLGNDEPDRESDLFSTVYHCLPNRPLELMVGVSVMRDVPDKYQRNWDDFLLLTPYHLLETKLLRSSRPLTSKEPPEFTFPKDHEELERITEERCPPVMPEPYLVSHNIEGQRYRFDYRLAFDLTYCGVGSAVERIQKPKGSLLNLYNITKYKVPTLVASIKMGRLFRKVAYDPVDHQLTDTPNGVREYAVFSAYLDDRDRRG